MPSSPPQPPQPPQQNGQEIEQAFNIPISSESSNSSESSISSESITPSSSWIVDPSHSWGSRFSSLYSSWAEAVEFIPGQEEYQGRESSFRQSPHYNCGVTLSSGYTRYHFYDPTHQGTPMFNPVSLDTIPPQYLPDLFETEIIEEKKRRMQLQKERAERHEEAVARTKGVICGICMEEVVGKSRRSERRFGILPNCSHAFCIGCIRRWRQTDPSENKNRKMCPQCRIVSHFIIPSEIWVEEKAEKKSLITEYKDGMSNIHCKFFDHGNGECPFSDSCFYKHEVFGVFSILNEDGQWETNDIKSWLKKELEKELELYGAP